MTSGTPQQLASPRILAAVTRLHLNTGLIMMLTTEPAGQRAPRRAMTSRRTLSAGRIRRGQPLPGSRQQHGGTAWG